jgi:hypothetical protein
VQLGDNNSLGYKLGAENKRNIKQKKREGVPRGSIRLGQFSSRVSRGTLLLIPVRKWAPPRYKSPDRWAPPQCHVTVNQWATSLSLCHMASYYSVTSLSLCYMALHYRATSAAVNQIISAKGGVFNLTTNHNMPTQLN